MENHPALVGIIPRKNLWDIIQKKRWYHIPVESAPKNAPLAEYVGFYFPSVFGEAMRYRVSFYAEVKRVDIVKRIELFPEEKEHPRINEDYFQFHLEKIKKLGKPIPSLRWRRIVHIPTSREKLFGAKEINDLYDTSPLEEKMYLEMKKRKIWAERQVYVRVGEKNFCLDFEIPCHKGKIDVECDGEAYHTLPEALAKDRQRNNQLNSLGWNALRFSGKEINRTLRECLRTIEITIGNLGGISEAKILN